MLKILLITVTLGQSGGYVVDSDEFDAPETCELAAEVQNEDAVMRERFGHVPMLSYCASVIEVDV